MVVVDNSRNAFEVICESYWCWKIGCTTCGNTPFLKELERLVKAENKTGIEDVLSTASIKNISSHYETKLSDSISRSTHRLGRADWLGYLGLALLHHPSRKVTESWASQFIDLLPNNSAPISILETILANPNMLLRWQFLEEIETVLIGCKWQKGLQF